MEGDDSNIFTASFREAAEPVYSVKLRVKVVCQGFMINIYIQNTFSQHE